jgi:alkylation response protein AidB-like acyl-CoA dehydrogenase
VRFDLDDKQYAFREAVVGYLKAECPLSRALEPHNGGAGDLEIWRGLMHLGLGGLVVPETYGGLGLGLLDLAAVVEPLGRHAAPGPFLEHALATLAIVLGGSDEQKARWLPALAVGTRRASIALLDNRAQWTADTWTLEGDSTLSGGKQYVLHAEGADLIVVGLKDGRLALVEGEAPGITIARVPCTDGGKQLAHMTFAEVRFEPLPRAVGSRLVDAGLVLLAADSFGGASNCVAMAVAYAKVREQFGRTIGSFQAVKHQLADMALMVEPTVGLYWYAAHAFDNEPKAAPCAAALAKSHITEIYPKVARRTIEAHGGIGYTWDYGLHVWLKRALFNQAYLGMPRTHRTRIADMAGW